MRRREFLGTLAVAPLLMRNEVARGAVRTYEVTTRIELDESHDAGIAWIPLALGRTAPYQVDRGHTVSGNADKTRVETLPRFEHSRPRRRVGAHDAAAAGHRDDEGRDE
jgi:hypothetical protein